MDIFFSDPDAIPLPPDDVRIQELRAEPWPDNRRVRVYLEITPFQQRPDGNIIIKDAEGQEVANVSIIETIDPKMEFTLHLRGPVRPGTYQVTATLFYQAKDEDQEAGALSSPDERKQRVVDQATTQFSIQLGYAE